MQFIMGCCFVDACNIQLVSFFSWTDAVSATHVSVNTPTVMFFRSVWQGLFYIIFCLAVAALAHQVHVLCLGVVCIFMWPSCLDEIKVS